VNDSKMGHIVSGLVVLKNNNTLDEIPQSFLLRKDNSVCNRGEEKGTAPQSLFPPQNTPQHLSFRGFTQNYWA